MKLTTCVLILITPAALGCSKKPAAPAGDQGVSSAARPVAVQTATERAETSGAVAPVAAHGSDPSQQMPPGHPPLDQAQGQAQPASPAAAGMTVTVSGKVLETMDSGGYTYLKLKNASGETWAAVRQAGVKKGSDVTVVDGMTMNGFESKTLNRKFDTIVFGSLKGEAQDPAAVMAQQHASAASGPADVGEIKVARAEGADAKTIAEVYAQKTALKGQNVAVRGKVVKVNNGIMGRNWVHVRDGSGSTDKKDNDLTVTTMQTAAMGDVITIRGTVSLDKDFGAGYVYPVIVEDASIAK